MDCEEHRCELGMGGTRKGVAFEVGKDVTLDKAAGLWTVNKAPT